MLVLQGNHGKSIFLEDWLVRLKPEESFWVSLDGHVFSPLIDYYVDINIEEENKINDFYDFILSKINRLHRYVIIYGNYSYNKMKLIFEMIEKLEEFDNSIVYLVTCLQR